jgi:hypothetical protein
VKLIDLSLYVPLLLWEIKLHRAAKCVVVSEQYYVTTCVT